MYIEIHSMMSIQPTDSIIIQHWLFLWILFLFQFSSLCAVVLRLRQKFEQKKNVRENRIYLFEDGMRRTFFDTFITNIRSIWEGYWEVITRTIWWMMMALEWGILGMKGKMSFLENNLNELSLRFLKVVKGKSLF